MPEDCLTNSLENRKRICARRLTWPSPWLRSFCGSTKSRRPCPGGGGDNDGGLSRRLFGTFLTWLQEKRQEVFVVATANDLSQLPPELLRKGRFDEVFFVDLPDGKERQTIFEIHLKLRRQDPENFDLAQLVEAADGYSGAEIEQAVIAALYRGLHQKQPLDTGLLLKEISETMPLSVSRREDIQRLRDIARERFVNVA